MIQSIKRTFGDRAFLKSALALIFPIAMQNLLMSGVNFLDNIMIGRLGEAPIAAVSLANQYYFVLNLVCFGVCSGAGIFISQFWGKGDMPNIRRSLAINIIASSVISLLFALLAYFAPEFIMRVFTPESEVVELGTKYLRIIIISYIPTAISMALQIGLKSIGRTRIPLLMALVALCLNGVLNYAFIFGNFGAPALGVAGAAIATSITRISELALNIVLIAIYSPDMMIRFSDIKGITKSFLNRFSATVVPVVANEFFWGLGTCLYSTVYGRMGTNTVAAVSISTTIDKLLNVFMFGMGNAAVVMIGSKIGAGDLKAGREYASRFSVMAWTMGAVMAVIIISVAPLVLEIFKVEAAVRTTAFWILVDIGIMTILQFFNHTNFVGTLRGGGDTRFCFVIDFAGVWLISLPLLIVFGLLLKVPIEITYLVLIVEQIMKAIFISRRLKSGKWISNLVKDL